MQGIAAERGTGVVAKDRRAGSARRRLGSAGALALGCGFGPGRHSPEEMAAWFFERGEEWIVDALEEVDADEAEIEAAREVLDGRRPRVTTALESFFREQRGLLGTLAGGAATPELLERHTGFEVEHEAALREIGALHEAIGEAVGPATWEEAREHMQERARERLEEE